MAVDLNRQRLFIAELGNDSVGVVDLANRSLLRTIPGLSEPQGVGYDPSSDTLFVANAGDGSVRLLDGGGYKTTGEIELGSDADNVRIDAGAKQVVVGFGDGALAVLDPSTRSKVRSVSLKAHPESFQIVQGRIFVNLPDVHAIAVVDGVSGKQVATWPMAKGGNFAMAADRDRGRILVASGATAPSIASVDDFSRALLSARTIVYADPNRGGAAGIHIARVIQDLGIAEQLRPKIKFGAGGDITEVTVTHGEGALGMTQVSEIVGKRGAVFVGPLPEKIQNYMTL
jgi:YVTN family beta-propeller protein